MKRFYFFSIFKLKGLDGIRILELCTKYCSIAFVDFKISLAVPPQLQYVHQAHSFYQLCQIGFLRYGQLLK